MRSLQVLKRLARQAVDRERLALATIAAEIAEVEGRIEALLRSIERETAAPLDLMTSGATLGAFVQEGRARVRALRDRLDRLQDSYAAQLERVQVERVEQKRYELLAERRAQQAARQAAAKEQKAIEELVTMRERRGRGPL